MGNDFISKPKAYARFAGLNYLIIFALAIFANFFIMGKLVVSGDAVTTASNIMQNESLFRLGVACFFVVMIADVFVAWALYLVLRPVDAHLSLLSAFFRLTYTIAQIGVLMNLVKVLQLGGRPEIYNALTAEAGAAFLYFFLASHQGEFTLTLIFFGIHLLLLGYLIIRSKYLPALIGLLVTVAGAGYLVDGFAEILFDGYGKFGGLGLYIVILPALLGEGALCLWLLLRGLNQKKWDEMLNAV
ncbi:DUF4386 domain-containing protein [Hyphococcus sp.]|uniref:DUF4386 domain-containing protein n=1 Tax=Hyphococcus sp. TaxID=2038636 RepID=UPI00208962D5|nr:MAG: DUF4386 domain-containing protein [Marinicaulis sp.]